MLGPDEMHVIAQLEDRIDELEEKTEQLKHHYAVSGSLMSLVFRLASLLNLLALDLDADTKAETVADIHDIAAQISKLTDILKDGSDTDGDQDSD